MPNVDLTQLITAADKTAQEQQTRAAGVKAERHRRLEAGKAFVLSFGTIPAQGRAFDQTVIVALMMRASALIAQSSTDTLTYRDRANVVHELTAVEFLEFGQTAMLWVEAVMAASWSLIDGSNIPADYTDDSHWPT